MLQPATDSMSVMLRHAGHLLRRSWDSFIGSLGSTTLGFIAPFAVPTAGLLVYAIITFSREGWVGVKTHFKQTLTTAALVAVAAELVVYGPILAWNVFRTVYADHTSLA